ncbi:hypothetical protein ACS0TY_016621 [Phlomoides rotata]
MLLIALNTLWRLIIWTRWHEKGGLWRWLNEKGSLCVKVVESKCGSLRGGGAPLQVTVRGSGQWSGWWKDVVNLTLGEYGGWFRDRPLKVIAHSWRVLWDRLPTKVNLRRRNILNSSHNLKCVLCNEKDETGRHIFFECEVSYKIWVMCFK